MPAFAGRTLTVPNPVQILIAGRRPSESVSKIEGVRSSELEDRFYRDDSDEFFRAAPCTARIWFITIEHMSIRRMEHVGIVVDDLAAATEFFVELAPRVR